MLPRFTQLWISAQAVAARDRRFRRLLHSIAKFCVSTGSSKRPSTKDVTKSTAFEGTFCVLPRVDIYFYLEDDTIHVSEPKTSNSGIPQGKLCLNIGTLIRRHRIVKPGAANGQHYSVMDINVGMQITFYARTFKIVACDESTRVFDFVT